MNYLKIYCNLIRKAESRTILPEGYTEKHHIFPVSIYGKNDGTVILSGREHFIAHYLLEKICIKRYGLKHWKTVKMNFAFISMKGNNREYNNSYLYENAKKRRSECMKGVIVNKGYKHSQNTKQKMSEERKGKKWWNNGVIDVRSKECPGKEWKNGRMKIQCGRVTSEETKRKQSESMKGRKNPKHSENMKGEKNHMFGKKRPKHSENMKGKNHPNYCKGSFYEIIFPSGEIGYTCLLQNFCERNNLDRGAICKVINNQVRHHKGWTVFKLD